MAFLNFIFKDRQQGGEEPDEASPSPADEHGDVPSQASAEGEKPEPETEGPADTEASILEDAPDLDAADLDAAEDMNLEQLVEALQLISEFLGDEDEPEESAEDLKNAFTLEFTVEQVSDVLTEAFDRKAVASTDTTQKVRVIVEDVFAQLGRGKVVTTIARILAEIKPDMIATGYDRYSKDEVSLPLHLVVDQVQEGELEKRTATEDAAPDLDSMPNLFAGAPSADADGDEPRQEEPRQSELDDPFSMGSPRTEKAEVDVEASPKEEGSLKFELSENASIFNFGSTSTGDSEVDSTTEESPPAEAAAEPAAEESPLSEPPAEPSPESAAEETLLSEASPEPSPEPETPVEESPPVAPEPVMPTAPVDPEPMTSVADDQHEDDDALIDVDAPERTHGVMLGSLDLNTANVQLISSQLKGVGPKLAARIVRHRDVNGPFRSIADLTRIQGVGPSTFEKMTGASWSEARDSLKRTLDYVLGGKGEDIPDLKGVARRVSSLSGFEGCVFTHNDGHMLAASWDHDKCDVLGAVAPQVFKKLLPYIEELDVGDLNPVTLFLGDTAIAVLQSGDIVMATIHRTGAFSRRQVRLIELIGTELEQRLDASANE